MNWEIIGKLSLAFICLFVIIGIIILIISIIEWKSYIDAKIELQNQVNEKLFQTLKDIKDTVEKEI